MGRFVDWERVDGLIAPTSHGLLDRPRGRDVVLGALFALGVAVEAAVSDWPYELLAVVVGLVWAMAVAWRRVLPPHVLWVLAIGDIGTDLTAAFLGDEYVGTTAGGLAFATGLYGVVRWAPAHMIRPFLPLLLVVVPATSMLNPGEDPAWVWALVEVGVTLVVIAAALVIRSRDALRVQHARAELAEERNQVANDVHDSVAHHMSAIAIRAEGASGLTDLAQIEEALAEIKRSASAGLGEVRELVTNLRGADPLPSATMGLHDIHQLAESPMDGLVVEVSVTGPVDQVAAATTTTAYAIAREALTNVRRHATGATMATITVRATSQYLDLTIQDDGATPVMGSPRAGFGIGVMTERAQALGGKLKAGPAATGGWVVSARLPADDGGER